MSAEILVTVGADGTLELTTSAALQTIEVASPGPEGPGAPRGGATNQVVAKASGADLDFKFVTLTPQFVGAEPAVTSGTASDYWRGDKTWRNFFADVRAATLTGLSTAVNAAVTAADTVLGAIGKLQAQVTGLISSKLDVAAPSFGGNAATATRLQTARTVTIGNTGKSFDGSSNVSWSLAEIGAPAANGTGATGTWGVSVSGNAATATRLQTARTISLSGAVSGSGSFDGSANATINTSIVAPEHGNWFNGIPRVLSDGVMEIGKYIDFHETSATTADFDGRLSVEAGGELYYYKSNGTINLVYHSGNFGDPFKGANQSLASGGYQRLPGGLILQWGVTSQGSPRAITFPVAFPNACVAIAGGHTTYTTTAGLVVFGVRNLSPTGFTATVRDQVGNDVTFGGTSWIAIGY